MRATNVRRWEALTLVVMMAVGVAAAWPGPTAGAGAESGPRAFYVAPNGNDAWTGHLLAPNSEKTDGPFATITRARDAVRQLKATEGGLREPVKVEVLPIVKTEFGSL